MGWLTEVVGALHAADIDVDLRSEWGAESNIDGRADDPDREALFVHYVGPAVRDAQMAGNVASERALMRAIDRHHLHTNGWSGGFAYSGAVGQSGRFYEGRGDKRPAATSGDYDGDGFSNNTEGKAVILLIGEGQEPSAAALATLRLIADVTAAPQGAVPHRAAKGTATECPGGALVGWCEGFNAGTLDQAPADQPASPPPAPSGSRSVDVNVQLPLLRREARPDVKVSTKLVQHCCTARWGIPTPVDGLFGSDTERKVREVQQRCGVATDGVVGPVTWACLLTGKAPS